MKAIIEAKRILGNGYTKVYKSNFDMCFEPINEKDEKEIKEKLLECFSGIWGFSEEEISVIFYNN